MFSFCSQRVKRTSRRSAIDAASGPAEIGLPARRLRGGPVGTPPNAGTKTKSSS